jgi:hypothetical protein
MQYIGSVIIIRVLSYCIIGVCFFSGRELRSMGFFLCVCTMVASLVEMGAKIFHLYGVGCAQGLFGAYSGF